MSRDRFTHVIRGKRFRVDLAAKLPPGCYGECSSPADTKRDMRIRKGMTARKSLEILLHEFMHAVQWDLDESVVERIAKDGAGLLIKAGYRRTEG